MIAISPFRILSWLAASLLLASAPVGVRAQSDSSAITVDVVTGFYTGYGYNNGQNYPVANSFRNPYFPPIEHPNGYLYLFGTLIFNGSYLDPQAKLLNHGAYTPLTGGLYSAYTVGENTISDDWNTLSEHVWALYDGIRTAPVINSKGEIILPLSNIRSGAIVGKEDPAIYAGPLTHLHFGGLFKIIPQAGGGVHKAIIWQSLGNVNRPYALTVGPDNTIYGYDTLGSLTGYLDTYADTVATYEAAGVLPDSPRIFKIDPDGNFSVVHEFNGGLDGKPALLIASSDGWLYGVASIHTETVRNATTNAYEYPELSAARIFRIRQDGSGYQVLHQFDRYASKLPWVYGDDVLSPTSRPGLTLGEDGYLYGNVMRSFPESRAHPTPADPGSLYRIKADGSGTIEFQETPSGDHTNNLVWANGYLYGIRSLTSIYRVDTANWSSAAAYETLFTRSEKDSDGYYPEGASINSLTLASDGNLYAVASSSGPDSPLYPGADRQGTLLRVNLVDSGPSATLSLSASPLTLVQGESITLSWSGADTANCVASGGWSGERATSGSADVTVADLGAVNYTLSCDDLVKGGSSKISRTASVYTTPADYIMLPPEDIGNGGGGGALPAWLLALLAYGAVIAAGRRHAARWDSKNSAPPVQ